MSTDNRHGVEVMSEGWTVDDEDAAMWRDMRRMAYCVILLTQRRENLWSLPVSNADLHTYAPPKSHEDSIRLQEEFGQASITVSCNALMALAGVTGSDSPPEAFSTLAEIERHRGPRGGYGSFSPGKDGPKVHSIPRHTASAVITHLLFPSLPWKDDHVSHLGESVRWLLKNREKQGGWAHSPDQRPAIGFMSTATSLCALALYLDAGHASRSLAKTIRAALASGYKALTNAQNSGTWTGDGAPKEFETLDSAFTLRILKVGDRLGTVTANIPPESPSIRDLVSRFSQNATTDGWSPSRFATRPDTVTSISALQVVLDVGNPGAIDDATLCSIEQKILNEWRSEVLLAQLTGWDWQCLANLAAIRAGPMDPSEVHRLGRQCENIRKTWLSGNLTTSDLVPLDRRIRSTVGFALTKGAGLESRWKVRIQRLPKWVLSKVVDNVMSALVALVLALLVALISFLALKDPGAISHAFHNLID
jgi:hypothetical protein